MAFVATLTSGIMGMGADPRPAVAQGAPAEQVLPGPLVEEAFNLLMDQFVTLPSPQTLLAGGWDGGSQFMQEHAATEPPGDPPALAEDCGQARQAFLGSYPRLVTALGDAAPQVELDRAIISGMAASLNSSHTRLAECGARPQGQQYAGVGIRTIATNLVHEVFPGSPAEAAGVDIGDRLVAVDGMSVEELTAPGMSERLRGPVGTSVRISVRRADELLDFTMDRAEIMVDWITSRVLDDQIGYLRVRAFATRDDPAPLDAAMARLSDANVRALVIDLREAVGGQAPGPVASRSIQDGDLLVLTSRHYPRQLIRTSGGYWGRNVPPVVLVSERTASAGEMLAAFLREHGVAELVGTPTAGAVENSRQFQLADGSWLLIAVGSVETAGGTVLEGNPLQPDIVVGPDLELLAQGTDNQLEAALEHLRGKLDR